MLSSPKLVRPFPPGYTLTCFRAKGGPRTRQLALEWDEADGSRWIATVDLTTKWKDYTLLPDRFKAWPPLAPDEGHRQFRPAQAVGCCVGLALSHTALEGDQHEYWFDNLGTAPNPFGADVPPAEPQAPELESISPSYQCYPITTRVVVRADREKVALEDWEARSEKGTGGTHCPALGFSRGRGAWGSIRSGLTGGNRCWGLTICGPRTIAARWARWW